MAKLRSINPANGKEIGSVKIATKGEVEEAVNRAKKSLEKWSGLGLKARAKILIKAAGLIQKQTEKLAKMITLEMGKPLAAAVGEVEGAAEEMQWLVGEAERVLRDEVVEPKLAASKIKQMEKQGVEDAVDWLVKKGEKEVTVVRYGRVGVVALIKPWNYPVETVLISLVPALMAGNSVILKPSEYVSLVSEELVKLFHQAGVPKEVLQALYGRGQVGSMLVDSDIDMVSFTGSSEVGKEIALKCAEGFKKYVLELGGSSPAIVCQDADLEIAVNEIMAQRFSNCGQICSAIKRVFVEAGVAKEFVKMLVERTAALKVGDGMDKDTEVGPLVSEKQLKKLQRQVTTGVVQSGRILTGGRRIRTEDKLEGFYHEPTIMVFVNQRMNIMQEEVFGPVLPVCEVDSFKQAIKQANNSKYGLTAAVFTKDKAKAMEAMEKLEAGAVIVNEAGCWNVKACWGGIKESGVGVELGKHGIWEYVNIKQMRINLKADTKRAGWFKITPDRVDKAKKD